MTLLYAQWGRKRCAAKILSHSFRQHSFVVSMCGCSARARTSNPNTTTLFSELVGLLFASALDRFTARKLICTRSVRVVVCSSIWWSSSLTATLKNTRKILFPSYVYSESVQNNTPTQSDGNVYTLCLLYRVYIILVYYAILYTLYINDALKCGLCGGHNASMFLFTTPHAAVADVRRQRRSRSRSRRNKETHACSPVCLQHISISIMCARRMECEARALNRADIRKIFTRSACTSPIFEFWAFART